jgi:phage baseplate assembly protein W
MPFKSIEINNANQVAQQPTKVSQFYKGFSSIDPANTGSKLYDLELIKQDILNQFSTRKGERVMNPTFGSIIWDLLMEPLTPQVTDALNKDIVTICNSDPRVIPTQINLKEYPTGYVIEVTLKLKGTDQSSNLIMTFDQKLGLRVQ